MIKKQFFCLIGVIALLTIAVLVCAYISTSNNKQDIEGAWVTRNVKQFGRDGPLAITYQFRNGELVITQLFQDGEQSSKSNYKLNGKIITIISSVDQMYDLQFKYEFENGGLIIRCVSETPEWKGAVLRFENKK